LRLLRTQVRAANLSGDCSFSQELLRGNLGLVAQQQACVRRRAELSVAMNPACGALGAARAAVNAVFDDCYRDTAPFDRAP
jgi:inner membrane protease ATP23